MSAGVDWVGGLDDLAEELGTFVDVLIADVVEPRMSAEVSAGMENMRSAYGGGTLADGLRHDKLEAGEHRIRNVAPHAHLKELGTQDRHTGSGHHTGRMPATPVIIPEAVHTRERITQGVTRDVAKLRFKTLTVTP